MPASQELQASGNTQIEIYVSKQAYFCAKYNILKYYCFTLQQHFKTVSKKILLSKLIVSLQMTICINVS